MSREEHQASIWGPTCDGVDKICDTLVMPELNVGDWMYFDNMGAYSVCAFTSFNGFLRPPSYYYIKEADRYSKKKEKKKLLLPLQCFSNDCLKRAE